MRFFERSDDQRNGAKMKTLIHWDDKALLVGVRDMDHQHRVLIDKINALYRLTHQPEKSALDVEKSFIDLISFVVKHFADEEAFMASIKFQGLSTHKVIHQQLLSRLHEHHNEFKIKNKVSEALFDFLTAWIPSHIRGIDMKYAKAFIGESEKRVA
jgi:hemerythrin